LDGELIPSRFLAAWIALPTTPSAALTNDPAMLVMPLIKPCTNACPAEASEKF
jgi:hypothetical protein